MHFYLWFFLLSIDIFFRHISSLPKRTRLSVFVTFSLLSSRRLWQQHPTKRLCRRATAEPRETLSLSPFSFSPRRAERVVGKSSSSSNSSRHRSIMVDEQRTTDNDRENAEGDDDGATAPVPEKVTLLLKHHRFFAFDKTTKRESRLCFRRSSSKVARKSSFERNAV